MEAKYPEITLGENICIKLKEIYFKDIPWVECYREVAKKLSELKVIGKKFYVDKNIIEVLTELNKYSHQDIIDAFDTRNVTRETSEWSARE